MQVLGAKMLRLLKAVVLLPVGVQMVLLLLGMVHLKVPLVP